MCEVPIPADSRLRPDAWPLGMASAMDPGDKAIRWHENSGASESTCFHRTNILPSGPPTQLLQWNYQHSPSPDYNELRTSEPHLHQRDPHQLHLYQGRAAVQHLLVKPAPGPLPGPPRICMRAVTRLQLKG